MRFFTYTWDYSDSGLPYPAYGIDTGRAGTGFYYVSFYLNNVYNDGSHDRDKLTSKNVEYVNSIPRDAELKLIQIIFGRKENG
jgi:hypothetical protein